MSLAGFNAETVEPSSGFDPIPAGDYVAKIIDAQWKDAQSGGRYLNVTWEIAEGHLAGRLVWDMLNLVNANDKTVTIAQQRLSAMCYATGKMHLQTENGEDMFHIPCMIRVGIKDDPSYGAKNVLKSVKELPKGGRVAGGGNQFARPAAQPAGRPASPQQRTASAAPAGQGRAPAFMQRNAQPAAMDDEIPF